MASRRPIGRTRTGARSAAARRAGPESEVVVIGLGRFGRALSLTLGTMGYEVLGIEAEPKLVQECSRELTHVVEADGTNYEALRQLGVGDARIAVVAIGTDLEASVLTVAALDDLRVPNIWAKALNERHAEILRRVGAHHVVLPEVEMGERVAHLVTGRMIEYVQLDSDFALVETAAPRELVGRTLAEAGVRAAYNVTVVCMRPAGGQWTYATYESTVAEGDLLMVAGPITAVERFSELP
ncbi:MAG: TrkA family potassium uptake protein [Acidimicrobiia bacterium]|nr:TrkA family potassium uptake protein [Acidimicrobiia bacterium]